jgi:hypothetical protein
VPAVGGVSALPGFSAVKLLRLARLPTTFAPSISRCVVARQQPSH